MRRVSTAIVMIDFMSIFDSICLGFLLEIPSRITLDLWRSHGFASQILPTLRQRPLIRDLLSWSPLASHLRARPNIAKICFLIDLSGRDCECTGLRIDDHRAKTFGSRIEAWPCDCSANVA